MARWTQRSYWKVVNGVRAQFDLSLAEAREAYRQLKERLGRSVFGTDLARHPRLVREEVRDARMKFVKAEEGYTRAITPADRARARQILEEEYDEYVDFEFTADTAGET